MLLLLAVLLTACRDNKEEIVSPDEDCYLDIYVYAPDRPIVTRGDVGEVKPKNDESKINTLQIWVFKHSNGDKVGYLGPGTDDDSNIPNPVLLNETGQQTYKMKVSKAFADSPEAVDVYVVANAASYVTTSLGAGTTRSELNDAMIGTNHFGTGTTPSGGITTGLQSTVPSEGLPMSAIAKNQPIYGSFPALRIGSETEITTLQLTRSVSKLRFVLCQIAGDQSSKKLVSIDNISLNADQIPTQTYLIPRESYTYEYSHAAINYGGINKSDIPAVADPMVYAYETQTAQEYEDLINAASDKESSRKEANLARLTELGITGLTVYDLPQLKELGLTYLRESDRQVAGTITYTYKESSKTENTEAEANFAIAAPGDFLRNHSWIIYAYYMDAEIHILTVTHIGMKKWIDDEDHESVTVYNW